MVIPASFCEIHPLCPSSGARSHVDFIPAVLMFLNAEMARLGLDRPGFSFLSRILLSVVIMLWLNSNDSTSTQTKNDA
jgi:hypothetical protein